MESANWLETTLASIPAAKVGVFGDFCLDCYWLIDPDLSERSVETGKCVHRVRRQRYSLGGAGNLAANLAALGVGEIHVVGLIGRDMFGRRMLELLRECGAQCDGMLQSQDDWQTPAYSKPCIEEEEQNRIDFGAFNTLADETADALLRELDRVAGLCNVVILNEQVPAGITTASMVEKINTVVKNHPKTQFIVDSRHKAALYKGCLFKVNAHEAARLLGEDRPLDERIGAEEAKTLARRVRERTKQAVFLTRGENGLLVCDGEGLHEIPGILIVERTDPVGAGDTTLATIASVLASGGDAKTAGTLANIAASITVRKLQTTGTASPEELRAVGPTPDYVYTPELADDPRGARILEGTEIEIVRDLPENLDIRHAIFDHDGTISTLRQGWEQIMEPMMIRAILGKRYADADEGLYHKVVDTVRRYIDKTTGIQTLSQMRGLVELVKQFGCVPEKDILDIHGYKAVYNEELLAMVRTRVEKLRRGELDSADFQIKKALELLEFLHARGVKLYMASGTDQADVVAEAESLGYAGLFEGRVFGAVGDVNVEAKRDVLERIFRENALSGASVAVFGDGPVEMREARKRNGVAVGVASDEVRRFGANPSKRARLIRAGADLIVPDFSQWQRLTKTLGFSK
ncbi:MAG: HAD family hydrolase [Phycisphaerae bacterium]|nr:HAD family hydrolase [Phycisphaerae bacterium]